MQKRCYATAVEHGWWEDEVNIPEKIALMHSELSEALEEFRNHQPFFYLSDVPGKTAKPEGIAVELADCIIRILDLAGHMGWDMEEITLGKMRYNETREYRHGGKKI